MKSVLLSTTYFGPVQWYQKLHRSDVVYIEQHENFIKQTYRNRCLIAAPNGVQALTVPVEKPTPNPSRKEGSADTRHSTSPQATIRHSSLVIPHSSPRISDHNHWRRVHWNALMTAYGESPFFDYYADDIRPFFEEKWEYLFDFNLAIVYKMCELLDIHPDIRLTETYRHPSSLTPENYPLTSHPSPLTPLLDLRSAIHPKHPQPDADFTPNPYYQVYRQKHGFLPNLSILDLLFNMGNEAIFYL